MAQDPALVRRGLVLLGMMLALVTLVGFLLFRSGPPAAPAQLKHPELMVLTVPNPGFAFPGQINWISVVKTAEALPSSPGWQIRYNATYALARHGSKKLPLKVLREMLDEEQQMRNFRLVLVDGKEIPDEAAAWRAVLDGLKAVNEWHKHKEALAAADKEALRRVYVALDKLTQSSNATVREEAEKTKKGIGL